MTRVQIIAIRPSRWGRRSPIPSPASRRGSVPAYVGAQLVGGALAVGLVAGLYPGLEKSADDVVVPHEPSAAGLADAAPHATARGDGRG